jgi:hypothetical protein
MSYMLRLNQGTLSWNLTNFLGLRGSSPHSKRWKCIIKKKGGWSLIIITHGFILFQFSDIKKLKTFLFRKRKFIEI